MEAWRENLRNPPKESRPVPFWSWNERLREEETRRQIEEMGKAGLGGYFMHARGGLQTPYMGEEWMANIQAGIDEGARRGMGAWGYDENGWPRNTSRNICASPLPTSRRILPARWPTSLAVDGCCICTMR